MLREEEGEAERENTGDEEGIEGTLGQGELVVGTEPFTTDEVASEFQEEDVVVTGAADGGAVVGDGESERPEGKANR